MLNKKDQKIINVLKEDSRKSIRDIAKLTKLRPSTVHLRLQKLKKENIIEKFTVKLDNKAVDENFIVFLFITTEDNLPKTFLNSPNIKEVFGITGEYDLLLKLKFKDIEEFNKFLINLRKNKNIRKTLTMVSTVNVKEEM
tara:strand:- start:386 stop:805 length:420 start_codon:yes stop_codon:yes gene_type:complete